MSEFERCLKERRLLKIDVSRKIIKKGFLFENFVFSQLNRYKRPLNYWRTTSKAEVDFIYDDIPIEVKVTPKITRALQSFLTTYSPPTAVIANYETIEKQEYQNSAIISIPASLL